MQPLRSKPLKRSQQPRTGVPAGSVAVTHVIESGDDHLPRGSVQAAVPHINCHLPIAEESERFRCQVAVVQNQLEDHELRESLQK
eukprot:COSAG05_NODE_16386_length_347_cov_0.830645_1_plen_84_part_01